jgi:thiamine pyrophosphate-dependent acetolactate synthase large subunit-like protein
MNVKENLSPAIFHDAPVRSRESAEYWGSDVFAAVMRELDIPYISLNPGASYRGLHDSIVNYLGNRTPQMLLSIHDENAVTIAHGYAKATDRMMAAALHSNVGLMHATMSIFDAWCDRAPVLILGATGPWDAAKRRPWIDWVHTASDQGALIRDFTKWDNQPGSVEAAMEAMLRGAQIAQTAPRGPVYINLDISLQMGKIGAMPNMPDVKRYAAPAMILPAREEVAKAAKLLSEAKNPLLLAGRCSRDLDAWKARVALAEKLNMRALTNLKVAASFPTDHRLHAAPAANRFGPETHKMITEADVILSLDWLDLAGLLKSAYGSKPVTAKIIQVSCDQHSHRGWSMDHQGLPPIDVYLMCEPEAAVPMLLEATKARPAGVHEPLAHKKPVASAEAVSLTGVADAMNKATRGIDVCLAHLPIGWGGANCHFAHPLDYLGAEGGAGVGSGPGIVVGAGLALKGSGRLCVGILGDGDFLMANTAVWTAAHYKIPSLFVVCNNRSFFNDELHQERVAKERGRPPENRWIGMRIGDPDIDLAAMGKSMGAVGIGPVTRPSELQSAIDKGIETAMNGGVCVVDARVLPGYDADG